MRDLRRQALESGKTVSRKAQSKQSSRASSAVNSAANSRAGSRNASRHGSDEEDGNLSDSTSWSVNSVDEDIVSEEIDSIADAEKARLAGRIDQILDRKRSSTTSREETYAGYCRVLTSRYLEEDLNPHVTALLPFFLKSIKQESSEKEAASALKALGLTLITSPEAILYEIISPPLQLVISDSVSPLIKAAAIHCLSAALIYTSAGPASILHTLELLLEIIESDGASVSAPDSASVVTAALEEWAVLATHLDDISDISHDAIDAFVEQLDSSELTVQIAAGECIALCYEKSYTEREPGEDVPATSSASSDSEDEAPRRHGPRMIKRYTPYRRTEHLLNTLRRLAKLSSHRISKRDKKTLHTNFADILNSVEYPTRGPRYQNAISQETGRRYGSRMVVRIHKEGVMRIDTWWKMMRLKALRRVLGGGFVAHYEKNEKVWEELPVMVVNEK